MCMVTAIALLAVYRLGILLNGRPRVAAATTLLTAIYPIWFAQSTLAHADMFAAAATLWGMVFAFAGLRRAPALWGRGGLLCRGRLVQRNSHCYAPGDCAVGDLPLLAQHRQKIAARTSALGLVMLLPAHPLLAWYAYYRYRTGYIFGNPEFLRYNATSTLSPLRILLALAHRILQLTAHMNMFVPVLCMLGAMLLLPLLERDGTTRPRISPADQAMLYVVMLAKSSSFP